MADQDGLFGRNIRDFVVGKLIGEGGFGRVYRGEQPTLGREVVIKVLHDRQRARDDLLQRFLREAQLASRLAHPYAAHIYGFGGEADGLVWIAMEYVHGITLKHWLRDRGPMSLAQLVPFFERVAEVVQEAHDHGIVHRDLKPSTPDTIRWLRALGVSKISDEVLRQFREGRPSTVTGSSPLPGGGPLTPDHATIGTPGYMAPEQWSHAFSVGPWSDLYALGVIAFEALTGHRPFEDPSISGILALPSRDPPRRDQVPPLGGDFPPALDQVFQRALAERPDRRFGSAPELAGALRAASGLDAGRADLPQADLPKLDEDVRDAWLADAPQPLAESVAVLDSARNAHQAHIATQEVARNLLRYLLAVTLAARVQTRESRTTRRCSICSGSCGPSTGASSTWRSGSSSCACSCGHRTAGAALIRSPSWSIW